MKFKGSQIGVSHFQIENKDYRWEYCHNPSNLPTTVLMLGITTEEKNIILIKLFRFPVNNFCIELPGGTINDRESTEEASQREFLQETGYSSGSKFEFLCKGFLYSGGSNDQFVVYFSPKCTKIKEIDLDLVEEYCGLKVIEMSPHQVISKIGSGDINIDTPISHAILAAIAQGKIKL